MKILHLLSQRPEATGSGTYLQAMLRQASEKGHTNYLLAGGDSQVNHNTCSVEEAHDTRFVIFNSDELDFNLPGMSDVMPYPSSRFQDLTDKQIEKYLMAFLVQAKILIQRFRPDIIHSHHLWLLSSLIKIHFPSIPMVVSCHGSDLRQFHLCPHLRRKVTEGCRLAEKVFALTRHQKEHIAEHYGIAEDRIHITGAGFSSFIFNTVGRSVPSIPTLLYCGKLSRAKGVPWLLKALNILETEFWHLHLVGSGTGSEQRECLALAQLLGDKVTIHGALQQTELAALLRRSHIFVLPSLFEGLPLVVLEALACGCGVITTKLPGCVEIDQNIESDLISLVELPRLHLSDSPYPEDEEKFVINLRNTIDRALKQTAYYSEFSPQIQASVNNYSWENIFDQIEKHYFELLDKSANAV